MFDPSETTQKIFANKVRNNFPTEDVEFEFNRLLDEVDELEDALFCPNKDIAQEFADVAIFSMAIARMKGIDPENIFVYGDAEYSFTHDTRLNFEVIEEKVKDLGEALGGEQSKNIITNRLNDLIDHLSAFADIKGIDLRVAIKDKVAFNATRVYTKK